MVLILPIVFNQHLTNKSYHFYLPNQASKVMKKNLKIIDTVLTVQIKNHCVVKVDMEQFIALNIAKQVKFMQ